MADEKLSRPPQGGLNKVENPTDLVGFGERSYEVLRFGVTGIGCCLVLDLGWESLRNDTVQKKVQK